MKTHWTAKLASDLFPARIIDQSAQTAKEVAKASGYSVVQAQRLIGGKVQSGELEKVSKVVDGRTYPAYRIKK